MDFIDLNFRGSPRVIATAVLSGPDGITLIDPGPTSCLPALEAGLRDRGLSLRDVRTLLQVKLGDVAESDEIFSKLMGDVVEPRREFIQENALNASVDA